MDGQVKKMVLVPADLVSKQRPVDQQLTEIDQDMQNILASPGIPADVKMKLYGDALARHGVKRREAERPLQIHQQVIQKRGPDIELMRGVPDSKKEAAEALLKFLQDTPGIQWNEKKEMVVNGESIQGSNMVDLFHHAARDKSLNTLPIGWHQFMEALQRNNVPRMALGNRNLTKEPTTVSTQTETPQLPSSSRPRHTSRIINRTPQKGKGVLKFVSLYK